MVHMMMMTMVHIVMMTVHMVMMTVHMVMMTMVHSAACLRHPMYR
jgi:hypothetical protein